MTLRRARRPSPTMLEMIPTDRQAAFVVTLRDGGLTGWVCSDDRPPARFTGKLGLLAAVVEFEAAAHEPPAEGEASAERGR